MKKLVALLTISCVLGTSNCAWAQFSGTPTTPKQLGLKHGDVIKLKCLAKSPTVWLDGQVPSGNVLVNANQSVSGTRWRVELFGSNSFVKLRNLGDAPAGVRQHRYLSTYLNNAQRKSGVAGPFMAEKNDQAASAWQFHHAAISVSGKQERGIAIRAVISGLDWLRCRPGIPDVDFKYLPGGLEDRLIWHIIKQDK